MENVTAATSRTDTGSALDRGANILIERTGGNDGAPGVIVHHLCANVPGGAVHAQAGTLGSARNPLAHAHVNAPAVRLTR